MNHRSWAFVGAATATLLTSVVGVMSPAHAASGTFTQSTPIELAHNGARSLGAFVDPAFDIPDQGGASSEVTVTAPLNDAVVTRVSATLIVDHPHLDDLDLVLEAPDGRAVTLASDVGRDSSGERTFTFNHLAARLPDGALSDSFMFASPTDYDTPGDVDAHPVDPLSTLRAFGGSLVNGPGNGVWTLHASDDTRGNLGSVQFWSLDVSYGRPAAPSPSTLAVSGLPRDVTDVNLVLSHIYSSTLNTVELLLESPDGRYAHVLSDLLVNQAQGITLSLDDDASADLPRGVFESGRYRPRNYDGFDQSEPIADLDTMDMDAKLSVFDGGSANGTWKLWLTQEECCGATRVSDWSLEITAEDPAVPPVPPVPSVRADTTAPVLSGVHLTPGRLPTGVGARLQVASTEPARLAGVVQRKQSGGWKRVGAKRWSVHTGANTRLFYGKTAEGRLRTGRYRVLLVATDAAGNASDEVRRRFRVDRG